MSPLPKLSRDKAEQYRAEWLKAVHDLARQVRQWAEEQGWSVREEHRDIAEEQIGTYSVPVLWIETPLGEAVLEPMGKDVFSRAGRVDLYAWPSHYRVMLLQTPEGGWVVRTDSGLMWPQPWERNTFVSIAEGLIAAL